MFGNIFLNLSKSTFIAILDNPLIYNFRVCYRLAKKIIYPPRKSGQYGDLSFSAAISMWLAFCGFRRTKMR